MGRPIALLCALASLACASGPRSHWVRADGTLDPEQRSKDLSACASELGPNPQAPVDHQFRIRQCMRSRGWVERTADEGS